MKRNTGNSLRKSRTAIQLRCRKAHPDPGRDRATARRWPIIAGGTVQDLTSAPFL